MEERFQHRRFERKYFVTERQAMQIREVVRGYLVPDKFSEMRPNYMYPVYSLYIDSSDLTTYWATVRCEERRFKLRVRYYDDDPLSPLFFEIKHRENDCILKHRGAVHRCAGPALLAGQLPRPEHLFSDNPAHLAALHRFYHLMLHLDARPIATVAYQREAWMSPHGNSARVTIDRGVRGERQSQAVFTTQLSEPAYPFGDRCVLELKFTNRFPHWFRDLARHFGLLQSAAPKYCGSVASAKPAQAHGDGPQKMRQCLPVGALGPHCGHENFAH